jgi:hypothetical protein
VVVAGFKAWSRSFIELKRAAAIIGRETRTDRTSKKRLERIDLKPVREMVTRMKARKRSRELLPKRIEEAKARHRGRPNRHRPSRLRITGSVSRCQ